MKTLVDCGCTAYVYDDGSGIEINYCPMHQAAPEMLKEIRFWADRFVGLSILNGVDRELAESRIRETRSLIAKAEGKP